MDTYAFANQKGGVGKTTITLGVASALERRGARVLLIDLDPQASATKVLGIDSAERCTVADALLEPDRYQLADAITRTAWGFDLAPLNSRRVGHINTWLELGRQGSLAAGCACRPLPRRHNRGPGSRNAAAAAGMAGRARADSVRRPRASRRQFRHGRGRSRGSATLPIGEPGSGDLRDCRGRLRETCLRARQVRVAEVVRMARSVRHRQPWRRRRR